jgi:acyl carrier protein
MAPRRAGTTAAAGIWPRSRAISLPDQLDVDSRDLLNFVIALHDTLRVEIPEADYPKLSTLDDCVDYLAAAAAR